MMLGCFIPDWTLAGVLMLMWIMGLASGIAIARRNKNRTPS